MFRHDLIREVVEATLSPAVRRDLRRRAVDVALDAGAPLLEVASALASTAERGDTHAADLLSQAGSHASPPSTRPPRPIWWGVPSRSPSRTPQRHRRLLAEHVRAAVAGRPCRRCPRHRGTRAGRRCQPRPGSRGASRAGAGRLRTLLPRRRPSDRHGAAAARSARPVSAPDCSPHTPSPRSWSTTSTVSTPRWTKR